MPRAGGQAADQRKEIPITVGDYGAAVRRLSEAISSLDKADELARNFPEDSEGGPDAMRSAQVYALTGIGRALIAVSSELSDISGELQTTHRILADIRDSDNYS